MWSSVASKVASVVEYLLRNGDFTTFVSREGGSHMVGSWLGKRSNRTQRVDRVAAVPMPAGAGVLTCRVLDPVNQPVSHAEFVVMDTAGRKVVGGGWIRSGRSR